MNEEFLFKNLQSLPESLASEIQSSVVPSLPEPSKSGALTLKLDGVYIHSQHDPIKEAQRFSKEVPSDDEKRVFMLFGAGIGHIIPFLLEKKHCTVIWIEPVAFILKIALSIYDFSKEILDGKLILLLSPISETSFSDAMKGKSTYPISFLPHRGSLQWKEKEYTELRFTAEQLFHKKDVNLATLTRFEKIWAKNMIYNLPELSNMLPVNYLFGLAEDCKIVVAGAGPSLFYSIPKLQEYRDCFFLISVDTAVPILTEFGLEPDLIFSVDPQILNSQYLENYQGNAHLVFDPTSTYASLRLKSGPKATFLTSSPFPLLRLLTPDPNIEIGMVPFGGSVSTNASSLGTLMGGETFLVGQDLAFTEELAHAKGAVMEERLNFKESRYFRRELHNYRQLFALPQKRVTGVNGEIWITNEKMLIFKKWFEDHAKENDWKNLTYQGAKLDGIPSVKFEDCFFDRDKEQILRLKSKLKELLEKETSIISKKELMQNLEKSIKELESFEKPIAKGLEISKRLYRQIDLNQIEPRKFHEDLRVMELLDEEIAGKKGLNETLSLGIQRVILTVTENYEGSLTPKEKETPQLGIAKKSVVLYEGLFDATKRLKKQMKRTLFRMKEQSMESSF